MTQKKAITQINYFLFTAKFIEDYKQLKKLLARNMM
jgi:hypothetical protein